MSAGADSGSGRLRSGELVIAALLVMLLAMLSTPGDARAQSVDGDSDYVTEPTQPITTEPAVTEPEPTQPVVTQPEPPAHACGDCGAGVGDRATDEVVGGSGAQGCGGGCGANVGSGASSGIGTQSPGVSGAANGSYGGGSGGVDGRDAYTEAFGAAQSAGSVGGVATKAPSSKSASNEGSGDAEGDSGSGKTTEDQASGDQTVAEEDTAGVKAGSVGQETTEAESQNTAEAKRVSTPFYYAPGAAALLIGGIFIARRMFL